MENKADKIQEMIDSSKRDRIDIDLTKEDKFDDVRQKLEDERVLDFADFTNDEIKVINIKEDLKDFDYLSDSVLEPTENIILSQEEQNVVKVGGIEIKKPETETEILIDKISKDYKEPEKFIINPNAKPIIEFDKVFLKIDRDEIIKGVSLKILPGEFVYFVGKSGAGKSSLAKMIYREVKNTGGKIIIDEENISSYTNNQLPYLRRKVGVIFQDFKLLNDLTIYENVRFSLDVINFPKDQRREQVLKTLKMVGVLDHKDKYPNELSGGQQQRVAIARAIVDNPKIIVADEPTGNLDPQNALAIMEILNKINSFGTTIVMATHDVGIVNKYKNRVILFEKGYLVNESDGEYIYE